MTELEHTWQRRRKELAGNMLAMGFLLMSANTMGSIPSLGVNSGFFLLLTCRKHVEASLEC